MTFAAKPKETSRSRRRMNLARGDAGGDGEQAWWTCTSLNFENVGNAEDDGEYDDAQL